MAEVIHKDEIVLREIVTGARNLFEKYGLKKTTMEDIAHDVGKCKSALYYYFTCKDDIFKAVLEQEMNDLFIVTKTAIESAATGRDKLKAYFKTRLSKMNKMVNLSQVVKKDIMDHMCAIYEVKQKHNQDEINLIKEILAAGIETREFKKMNADSIELFSILVVTAVRGLEMPALIGNKYTDENKYTDMDQRIVALIDLLVEGIGHIR